MVVVAGVGRQAETSPALGIVQAGETAACGVAQVLKVDLAVVAGEVALQEPVLREAKAQLVAGVAVAAPLAMKMAAGEEEAAPRGHRLAQEGPLSRPGPQPDASQSHLLIYKNEEARSIMGTGLFILTYQSAISSQPPKCLLRS